MACKCKCKNKDGFIEFLSERKEELEEILDEHIKHRRLVGMEKTISEIHFIVNCAHMYQLWQNENQGGQGED